MRVRRVARAPSAADDEHRELPLALRQRRLSRREMVTERRDRVHELGIVHPNAVGPRQAAARAVDEKAIAGLLLRCHLLDRYFGVAAERGGVRHRVSSSSGLQPDVLRYVRGQLWRKRAAMSTRTQHSVRVMQFSGPAPVRLCPPPASPPPSQPSPARGEGVEGPERQGKNRELNGPATRSDPGAARAGHGHQAYSISRRALSPRWKVGAPPGTSVASRTSNSSSLVAPRRMARCIWATRLSRSAPRNARRAMTTNSRTLAETWRPSPRASS